MHVSMVAQNKIKSNVLQLQLHFFPFSSNFLVMRVVTASEFLLFCFCFHPNFNNVLVFQSLVVEKKTVMEEDLPKCACQL